MALQAWLPLVPVLLAGAAVYFHTLTWLLGTWPTYRGSHGPIILAVSVYMIWTNREEIGRLPVRPALLGGSVVTALGCFLLIAGRFGSLLLLQYFSLIVTLLGLVWLLGGTGHLKYLWYPIVYIVFMFPVFSEVVGGISIHLQNAAAAIAHPIIRAFGIAVYRHGQFIELPTITLEVARECNGINHIMALVSLAVPLAFWTQDSALKKSLLVAAALPIGVLANGIRVAIIGIMAVRHPGSPLHGPYSLFYVSFIFFFGMAALVCLGKVMGRRREGREHDGRTIPADVPGQREAGWKSPVICALAIFGLTGAYLAVLKPRPVPLVTSLAAFPSAIGDWEGRDADLSDGPFDEFLAQVELKRRYRDPVGHEVDLYVGYFPFQDQERKIVGIHFDHLQRDATRVAIDTPAGRREIKRKEIRGPGERRVVYFWYDIDGEIVVDRYPAKLKTIVGALRDRRTNAAIVVVSAVDEAESGFAVDFIRKVSQVVQTYVRNTGT